MSTRRPDHENARAGTPIRYDLRTGMLGGAMLVERTGIWLLRAITRVIPFPKVPGLTPLVAGVSALFPSRRDVLVTIADDAVFSFPYGDPYRSVLLLKALPYEPEIEAFLRVVKDMDFSFIDCGANYGFWSVKVTSRAYGAHPAIAIELSSPTAGRARKNAALNGERFEVLRRAVSDRSGETVTVFGGAKHEQRSIRADAVAGGALETAETIALDDLPVNAGAPVVLKLDIEGAEAAAMDGAANLLARDLVVLYEDHGNDPSHAVSRAMVKDHGMRVFAWTGGSSFVEILDLAELSAFKPVSRVGYDFFATRSPYWVNVLTGRCRSVAA